MLHDSDLTSSAITDTTVTEQTPPSGARPNIEGPGAANVLDASSGEQGAGKENSPKGPAEDVTKGTAGDLEKDSGKDGDDQEPDDDAEGSDQLGKDSTEDEDEDEDESEKTSKKGKQKAKASLNAEGKATPPPSSTCTHLTFSRLERRKSSRLSKKPKPFIPETNTTKPPPKSPKRSRRGGKGIVGGKQGSQVGSEGEDEQGQEAGGQASTDQNQAGGGQTPPPVSWVLTPSALLETPLETLLDSVPDMASDIIAQDPIYVASGKPKLCLENLPVCNVFFLC